ncbi:MAG: 30S ribosomal protein S16 [Candidatus Omnitrophica bacterium]|nr:30S ribosomal protein S16 [Candidatus Omnitrophota bacterium]
MALRIRLRRIGKNPKGKPHFRISVLDERKGRDGRVLEELGFYSPLTGESRVNKEKAKAWIKNGAQPSVTVKNLLKQTIRQEG